MAAHAKTLHVCQSCGFTSFKWLGRCPGCGEWNTLVEEVVQPPTASGPTAPAVPYTQVDKQDFIRTRTGIAEFDRVLGGGIVPGSLVLLGGEPGIGKSTLLLQVADGLSRQNLKVLYVAGEESAQQIKMRGERLAVDGHNLHLSGETSLDRVLRETTALRPAVLIIDSIQTLYTDKLSSVPGTIGQVRECAAQLLSFAKRENVPTFLIGHITKDGSIAGPKALEHIVDAVLYFEGERHQNQKIVRAVKNRFGPANELGIFQMTSRGLLGVDNPSRLFLSERAQQASGSVVLCAVEGSRPVLVELQALVTAGNYGTGRRMATGVDPNRVSLLLAMLEKRIGLHLLGSDVYVNVAGGLVVSEPAVDLAAVAAITSSFKNAPVANHTVIFGEVGLAGEVRAVNLAHTRVREALTLGFERVILPRSNLPLSEPVQGLELVGCSSVADCLEQL